MKKRSLKNSNIYFILDEQVCPDSRSFLKKIENAKINAIQLRDKKSPKAKILKKARSIKKRLSKKATLLIINDYPDIALKSRADGVHLGQKDAPLIKAREILGKNKIIGISCRNLKQAIAAQAGGADYISVGPIFKTQTKPEYKAIGLKILKEIKQKINIPFFAIGGISLSNLEKLISSGINRVAVCSLVGKSSNPAYILKKLAKKIAE